MSAHKPRSGSLAYYPKVRAKSQTAKYAVFKSEEAKEAKSASFYGYKAGMAHVFGRNAHDKSTSFGQEVMIPATVIECPPAKVIGVRLYKQTHYGLKALAETSIDRPGKHLRERIKAFKHIGKKKSKAKEEAKYSAFEDLEKLKEKTATVTLIVEVQPSLTGIGKKAADIAELGIAGSVEQQLLFAKGKLGKELRISEVFSQNQLLDVKAVDKGKGFVGVVKRAGVKVHRPKAKKHRYVGSIGPWHPATVMWTVARPGQLGYQTRTEYNKRVLAIGSNPATINPKGGFHNYGMVKGDYVLLTGSVPGPAKRIVALRGAVRVHDENMAKYTDVKMPNPEAAVKA
ncbi:MAG: 50S ribosomal protein L3 [Candidatus Diapherotrites archaeon]|uniref:50S ribosomal protein L3 n=1 Tax=Candidatus Iainarchaeum sp. TaxID=3101447 RepID=A0A8T3YK01_9ARCH|nr:50S ribosomal protein L3 [Candidatus Diapherotrites archaeon]